VPAFAELLPPLPDQQYAILEADILQNGCYSPVIVNEDFVIIDGHHRHGICERHGVPYRIAVFSFEDDLEAMQWALDTQKARRSMSTWDLGQIALKLKPEIEAKAAANKGMRTDLRTTLSEGFKAIDTKQELADVTGLSRGTVNKVIQIDERAPGHVKEALDGNNISLSAGYNIIRLLEKLPAEAREAAAERAVELAKQRKDYKAMFDLSFEDMNALIEESIESKDTLKMALNTGELSVNRGKEAAGFLLDMSEEMRKSAYLDDAEELADMEEEYRRKCKATDKSADIAVAYNGAFRKALDVNGTDHEVRMWLEYSGIRKVEYTKLIEDAEDAMERFARVAKVVRQIYETEVAPYEHLYEDRLDV
jgi:hypothetical protein